MVSRLRTSQSAPANTTVQPTKIATFALAFFYMSVMKASMMAIANAIHILAD